MNQQQRLFHFSLVIAGVDETTIGLEDALFAVGCDDGTLYFSEGTAYIVFDREADDLYSAIVSAVKDVESTPLGIKVTSVSPEHLVTISDIANRTHLSKQAISLLVKGKRGNGDFPRPLLKVDNKSALWRWLDVAVWLLQYKKLTDKKIVEEAKVIDAFNTALLIREPQHFKTARQLLREINGVV